MPSTVIRSVEIRDARFPLEAGAGADAVHLAPMYSFAVTLLQSGGQAHGTGLALTL